MIFKIPFFLIILPIVTLTLCASCNSKSFQCIHNKVEQLEHNTGFNYYEFSTAFENYLVENNHLNDDSYESWIEMLSTSSYCDIDNNHLILHVDNAFSTSPTLGEAFISCKGGIFSQLNQDSLVHHAPEYILSLAKQLGKNRFENISHKIFFIYQVNNIYPLCSQIGRNESN